MISRKCPDDQKRTVNPLFFWLSAFWRAVWRWRIQGKRCRACSCQSARQRGPWWCLLMNAVSWPSAFPLSLLGGNISALQTFPVHHPIKLAGVVLLGWAGKHVGPAA